MCCSGVSQDDKDRNTCQEMRVESSRAGHGRLFWRLSLWTAPWCQPPTPPPPLAVQANLSLWGRHVWSWLAGVLEEPPHCDQSPSFSLSFLFILSFLICLPVSLSSLLLFFFFSLPPPPPHFGLLFIYLFAFKHFWLVRFCPFHLYPWTHSFHFPLCLELLGLLSLYTSHQITRSDFLNTIIRTRAHSLAEPTPKSLLKRTSSLL